MLVGFVSLSPKKVQECISGRSTQRAALHLFHQTINRFFKPDIMKISNNQIESISIKTTPDFKSKVFKQSILTLMFACLILTGNNVFAHGGDDDDNPNVTLHVNSSLDICGFEAASTLTQSEFDKFGKEVGFILYFKPLTSAKPLGKFKFDLTLENGGLTSIDQTSGAWNNTFAHPDSVHYLGDEIMLPAIHIRMGISDKIDVGLWYSDSSPLKGNYAFLGYEVKYAFLNNTETGWAAAGRLSFVHDTNIKDFNMTTTGLDALVSKSFGGFSPYAGVVGTMSTVSEKSDRIDLENSNTLGARALIGAEFKWKFANIGAEADFGALTSYSFKIGATF